MRPLLASVALAVAVLLAVPCLGEPGGDAKKPRRPRPKTRLIADSLRHIQIPAPPRRAASRSKLTANVASNKAHYVVGFLQEFRKWTHRGARIRAMVLDDGLVYAEHPEFGDDDGKASRVEFAPGETSQYDPGDHPTAVASVMAARGTSKVCIGVAPALRLLSACYDDDLKKLRTAAKAGVTISNHSYTDYAGWTRGDEDDTKKPSSGARKWYWNSLKEDVEGEDRKFGKYSKDNSELDDLLCKFPHMISFAATGNFREGHPQEGDKRFIGDPTKPKEAVEVKGKWKPNDFKEGGLDTIVGLGLSKNAICIGAVAPLAQSGQPYQSSSFSGWGPADDGRIKPDLVAVGESVEVAVLQNAYGQDKGTSFAAPTAAGIGALLAEFFENKEKGRGRKPTSAEIKAVLIHTAIDAGEPGPDPKFGWGVINTLEAARVIAGQRKEMIERAKVGGDKCRTYTVTPHPESAGGIRVTLVWIDPAAPENKCGLNDPTPTLQNDLDVELVAPNGTLFHPYSLDRTRPLRPATRSGPNRVDNVERIDVDRATVLKVDGKRPWTVRVKAHRLKVGKEQEFALVISGAVPAPPERFVSKPPPIRSVGLTRGGWQFVGPPGLGGPIRALLIHPAEPRVLWAGCAAGGVWKTSDGGQSWAPVVRFPAYYPVTTLVMSPNDPDVLLAGTGDGSFSATARPGGGIFVSRDAGHSWTQLPASSTFQFVNRLAVSPDGRTLLVATRTGLFRSTNALTARPSEVTFTAVGPARADVMDVKFQPRNSSRCVAAGRGGRTYYSRDAGATWKANRPLGDFAPNEMFLGRVELAYALANPTIVYASVDKTGGQIYCSTDGGATYALRYKGAAGRPEEEGPLGYEGWFSNTIWAGHPTDPNLLAVGSINLHRSSNGGRTITRVTDWTVGYQGTPVYFHVVTAPGDHDGRNKKDLYVGCQNGVFRLTDLAKATVKNPGLTPLNGGLNASVVVGVAGHEKPGLLVVSPEHNGTWIRQAEGKRPPWKQVFGGRGGRCTVDVSDPNVFCTGYVYLQFFRTLDGGKTQDLVEITNEPFERANYTAPLLLDPNQPNVMLAGGASLWRSRNIKARKPEWSAIKPASGTSISAIAVPRGKGKSDVIWVGHNDGEIYRTSNGSADRPTWVRVDEGRTFLPRRFCTSITFDPVDPKTVCITYGGSLSGNVWKTTDNGAIWRNIGGALPAVAVTTLAVHPDRRDWLYVGTEVGLFVSEDGGKKWTPTNQGPANVAISELIWMNRVLVAGTSGRGVFQIDLSEP